ncbi:hypothetical protein ACWDRR_37135 [Kitasatospora sp. NPDC003701]
MYTSDYHARRRLPVGVDAREYGARYDVMVEVHAANWALHGRAAGPIRARQMIDSGVGVPVRRFPGNLGLRGIAEAAGVEVPGCSADLP